MLTLYHAPHSRSIRVRWLLEELGDVPYQVQTKGFDTMKSPEYLQIHPLGSVPAIQDGEVVMFESGAILEWLLERHGRGRLAPAPATPTRAKYLQWLHFGEATMAPPLVDLVRHRMFLPDAQRIPAVVAQAEQRCAQLLGVLETALAGRDHLCGDFTAADIMVGYALRLGGMLRVGLDGHPNVRAYFARLSARPAYERATV